ncbi:MAG: hypothetical protein AB7F75_10585 [Planctomycetota bacterium]
MAIMSKIATAKMTPPLEYFERLKYDTPERRHFMVICGAVVSLVILLNLLPDGEETSGVNTVVSSASNKKVEPVVDPRSGLMADASVAAEMRAEALAETERMASYRRFVKAGTAGSADADLMMNFEGTRAFLEEVLRKEPRRAGCRYLLVKYLVQGSYAGAGQFSSEPIMRASQELRMAIEASDPIEKKSWCLRLFTELQSFLVQADSPASRELLEILDKNSD